jgi:hypothetical protein
MCTRGTRTMVLGLFMLTLLCPFVYGQTEASSPPYFLTAPWKFDLAPYLWLPALQGDVMVERHTANVDLSVGDTLELLFDSFKVGALGRFEARKGELLLTLDVMYLSLEDEKTTVLGRRAEFSQQLLITEFGAGYRLGTWPLSPDIYPALATDVLVGGRYVSLEAGLETSGGRRFGGIDVEQEVDWLEPFVGGRLLLTLSPRVTLAVRGDVGGFGLGSELTWSLAGTLQFHLSRCFSLGVGYRALDIDYEQGSGARRFKFDVIMHGPLLGAVFHF